MSPVAPSLPSGVTFIERGWLSSNAIMLRGRHGTALVDSGYSAHAAQTVQLVRHWLAGSALEVLVSTHLHSDHCGGNAALQESYPDVVTHIPSTQLGLARQWDPVALSHVPTGQTCPRFRADVGLSAGQTIALGDQLWEVHAAPGHDPHSIVLFEPASRALISADALWENGFGVIFPELEGIDAFAEVEHTLSMIERLAPRVVLPGHGAVFGGERQIGDALRRAGSRLAKYRQHPERHAWHAAKVLLKFKLLETRHLPVAELHAWARHTSYVGLVSERYFGGRDPGELMVEAAGELVRRGEAEYRDGVLVDA